MTDINLEDEFCEKMVNSTVDIFNVIVKKLLPTPAKVHYTFNLRDLVCDVCVYLFSCVCVCAFVCVCMCVCVYVYVCIYVWIQSPRFGM